MAGEINYRKNLIKNPNGTQGLENWTANDKVDATEGSSDDYFVIWRTGKMSQKMSLPKIYPTEFQISAKMSENQNDNLNKPTLFFSIVVEYKSKKTEEIVKDVYTLPAVSPIFQNKSTGSGSRWNTVTTVVEFRSMASEESGWQIRSIEAEVINTGGETCQITSMEAFPLNGAPPTKGDGEEVPGEEVEEVDDDGRLIFKHESGSYVLIDHDIEIHAIGEIIMNYDGIPRGDIITEEKPLLLKHSSGSFISIAHDIEIYAIGEVLMRFEGVKKDG